MRMSLARLFPMKIKESSIFDRISTKVVGNISQTSISIDAKTKIVHEHPPIRSLVDLIRQVLNEPQSYYRMLMCVAHQNLMKGELSADELQVLAGLNLHDLFAPQGSQWISSPIGSYQERNIKPDLPYGQQLSFAIDDLLKEVSQSKSNSAIRKAWYD